MRAPRIKALSWTMEPSGSLLGGAGDLVSKVISRAIIGVTPFRVLITLLITYLLSPLPLQVIVGYLGYHGG